jgi:purine-binding chemotaxis protein CheW
MTAAAPASPAAEPGLLSQYLTFMLGREVFAFAILSIKEIIQYQVPTPVPMLVDYIRGVINLRGACVPVIDLPVRLGRPSSPTTKRTCIVILETRVNGECREFGVVVDAVNAVVDMDAGNISPPPSFGMKVQTSFVQGMGKDGDKFIVLLNVPTLLPEEAFGELLESSVEQPITA